MPIFKKNIYEKSDIEEYFKLKSDAETMYYLQDIRLFSMEEAEADLASVLLDMSSSGAQGIP